MTVVLERPAPVEAPPVRVRPYQLLAGLQVLDVATTWIILSHWTERAEGNPIVAFFFEHVGINVGCLLILVFKFVLVYLTYRKQTGVKLISAVYTAIILNNLLFLYLWFTT